MSQPIPIDYEQLLDVFMDQFETTIGCPYCMCETYRNDPVPLCCGEVHSETMFKKKTDPDVLYRDDEMDSLFETWLEKISK